MSKIGILDPTGKHANPLNDKEYSDTYYELAEIWSKFPAYEKANEIIEDINNNQVLLVVSGTGSGKTVLVPKFALHSTNYKGNIAITLPKQIIAKSAAEFAAKTLDVVLGQHVGYQYKGDSKKSDTTQLLYATDGTIVARLLNDPLLMDFDIVIIDEAHERKVQIDFLLYLLRNVVDRRKDFKVIIMSATINAQIFESYFNKYKFKRIDIGSESHYPIESIFLDKPISDKEYIDKGIDIIINILETDNNEGSDILFFITSVNEAQQVCQKLGSKLELNKIKDLSEKTFCVEIYSGVNPTQQKLAQDKELFKENTKYKNKVVVSTNVAESSLTIDGIKYVIDSGLELNNYYDPQYKADVLEKMMITQAQAKQRKGRAGRTKPGICYHLYTEEQYNNMKQYPEPSIRTSDISAECLRLLGLDLIDTVPKLIDTLAMFIEPPKEIYMKDSLMKLKRIGLIDFGTEKLTYLGVIASRISGYTPEQTISLLLSLCIECSHELSAIFAMINACNSSIDDIFITPKDLIQNNPDNEKLKNKLNKKFIDAKKSFFSQYGDHLSLLNIYTRFKAQYDKHGDSKIVSDWCYKYFIRQNILLKAMKEKKKIHMGIHRNINKDDLTLLKGTFKHYIEQANVNPNIKSLICILVGYKLNLASHANNVYVTNLSETECNISKASYVNFIESYPKKVVYDELFISTLFKNINIVSKYPPNFTFES